MIVVPAIDLREGACVQLRGGDYERELVRLSDPLSVAAAWRDAGFTRLHVVDLDAATRRGDNRDLVAQICSLEGVGVQVGGGVRTDADVARLLAAGAASVVVGTRAVDDPAWLAAMAAAHPGRVALGLDVRRGYVTTQGWTVQTSIDPLDAVARVEQLKLSAVVTTAVDVEGSEAGPDRGLVARLRAATGHPLWVAGGVSTRSHLASLDGLGVDAAVVGTALYTGALDPEGLNQEAWR